MKYRLAVFDMDGTILNTIDDIADTLNYCLEAKNMPLHSVDKVKGFVGNGIHRLVELAVPAGTSDAEIEEIYGQFISYYKDHCAIKTRPYEGINEVIESLRKAGVKTAVVSNKADAAVKSLCEDYFKGLFDVSIGDRDGQRRKPYPDSVLQVLKELGISREEAVYIGDSDVDYKTAQNAGLDVIMVGWGFRTKDFILSLGAKEVLETPDEILHCILE